MDKTKRFIVPGSPALIVRDPTNYNVIVPEKGMVVSVIGPVGRFWRKKIKTGEVKVVTPPQTEEMFNKAEKKRRND